MINYRFLNYKKYSTFEQDLPLISPDSIVFIQDRSCIWARGKLYQCGGSGSANVKDGVLTFLNSDDQEEFTITQDGGDLILRDSNGNESRASYVLYRDFTGALDNKVDKQPGKGLSSNDFTDSLLDKLNGLSQYDDSDLYNKVNALSAWKDLIDSIRDHFVMDYELHSVAYSGNYDDLSNKPASIIIDSQLSGTSTNPVLNKAVYNALLNKANKSDIVNFVTTEDFESALSGKQDTLTEGYGIQIRNNEISSTLDTEVYVIVSTLPSTSSASPNKIYIVETNNGDGTYRYTQYRLRNGVFVSFDQVLPEINLTAYIKTIDADSRYQPKGNYLTSADLALYAKLTDIDTLTLTLNDYITFEYGENTYQKKGNYVTVEVLENYVRREEVYTPKWGDLTDGSAYGYDEETIGGGTNQNTTNIVVDSKLNLESSNPVQNRVITLALQSKADISALDNYATVLQLNSKADKSLLDVFATISMLDAVENSKQDKLLAGRGIEIIDNRISTTLDTDLFVVVDQLPSTDVNENKIYILLRIDDATGEYVYDEYRWINDDFLIIGRRLMNIDLSNYITYNAGDARYQPIGDYLTLTKALELYNSFVGDYVTNLDFLGYKLLVSSTYQPIGNYALSEEVTELRKYIQQNYTTVDYVDGTFVKKVDVYTVGQNNSSSDQTEEPGGSSGGTTDNGSTITTGGDTIIYSIDVDSELSLVSINPVENAVITRELNKKLEMSDLLPYALAESLDLKADASSLAKYVKLDDFTNALSTKLNLLNAGYGIKILDNTISTDLDTSVYVIVDELPNTNINRNKIYLVRTTSNGQESYVQWRYDNEWIQVGATSPTIDLVPYLTKSDAQSTYQPIGDYATNTYVASTYQLKGDYILVSDVLRNYLPKGDYVLSETLEDLIRNISGEYQKKGEYALASDVADKLVQLQQIIDLKYVLKKDVYKPEESEWSSSDPVEISSGSDDENNTSVENCKCSMVTLTVEQYQLMVDAGTVDRDTYYFTYESDGSESSWTFGDKFPIILTEQWAFGGTFPITLS